MDGEKSAIRMEITNTETNQVHGKTEEKEREKWDKKIEYILSMVGYIVGLGNFWRFPYLCMRNGGGAFLIPFILCLIFIAFPLFFLETSLGQFNAKSVMHCWEVCPLFKGVGMGMVVLNMLCGIYYVMVIAWTLNFLYYSFILPLPWTTCGNPWNSDNCTAEGYTKMLTVPRNNTNITSLYSNTSLFNSTDYEYGDLHRNFSDRVTSQEEFWQHSVLDISSGLEDMGALKVNITMSLLISWVIAYLCLMKGVKSIGKVVYVTATLPYICLTILLVRGCTLPGAIEGIKYYITPNFSRITEPKVWIEAAIQVFYSTCVCWGPLINMASYNTFHNNCLRDSAFLLTMGEGFSIFGGFVVFSALGFMAHENGVSVEEVVKSGPGLIFVTYPEVVSKLPYPNVWAVIFFVTVLTIGLDSFFPSCEPLMSALSDSFQFFRKRRLIFTGLLMAAGFLLGLPFCFQGGIYLFQLMDWYIAAFCIPIFGIIECLIFGWIYGAEMYSQDVELMLGRPIPVLVRIMWCFITPVLLLILLIIIIMEYEPPTYGNYIYPDLANIVGLIYAVISLVPLFYYIIVALVNADGYTFSEKFYNSLKPTKLWHPGDKDEQKRYDKRYIWYPRWPDRLSWTLFGR